MADRELRWQNLDDTVSEPADTAEEMARSIVADLLRSAGAGA